MLTARTDEIDTILGLEAGADEYVTKPFKPRELRARVDAIMRRRNSQSQAINDAPAVPAEPQTTTPLGQTEGDLVRSLNGLTLNSSTYTVEVDGETKNITPTEFTLLDVLLGSNGVSAPRRSWFGGCVTRLGFRNLRVVGRRTICGGPHGKSAP